MRFYRQTTLCREGWYYLIITVIVLSGAVFKEVNLLLVLAGMLLGPLLANWRAVAANLRGLNLQRKLPQTLCAGDPLSVSLQLDNPRRRLATWAMVAEEQIHRENGDPHANHRQRAASAPTVLFPYVPAGQSRKGVYRGRLVERGRYRFGPLRISSRFPFGLCGRTITVGEVGHAGGLAAAGKTDRGLGCPATGGLGRRRPAGTGRAGGRFLRRARVAQRRRPTADPLAQLGPAGQTRGAAVRAAAQSRRAVVVLDLWQPDLPGAEHRENVELAVSFAATVLADLCRKGGSNVYLAVSNAGPQCEGGPASTALLQGLMERLAVVQASPADALPALLAHALHQIPLGTEIVLVSTRAVELGRRARFAAIFANPVLRDVPGTPAASILRASSFPVLSSGVTCGDLSRTPAPDQHGDAGGAGRFAAGDGRAQRGSAAVRGHCRSLGGVVDRPQRLVRAQSARGQLADGAGCHPLAPRFVSAGQRVQAIGLAWFLIYLQVILCSKPRTPALIGCW